MFIEQPAKWLRWLYPKAIWRMDKKDHSVYLTFDDGPIPESTPFILETLRKYNIKATFFMVGENVLRHHDLYNQIVAGVIRLATIHSIISVPSSTVSSPTCSTPIRRTISSMPISSVHLTAGCDQVSIGGCTALTRSSCGTW